MERIIYGFSSSSLKQGYNMGQSEEKMIDFLSSMEEYT